MTKMQMVALENAKKAFGDKEFSRKEWMDVACGKYGLSTAIYDGNVKSVQHVKRIYYTVKELVKMLNDCAGDDCYNCDWNFKVDENNNAYEEIITNTYKLV